MRRLKKFLWPSVLGVVAVPIALLISYAIIGSTGVQYSPGQLSWTYSFIGTFATTSAHGTTWHVGPLVASVGVALLISVACWIGGRVVTLLARPMRANHWFAIAVFIIAVASISAGAGWSKWYRGYFFTRPAVDSRLSQATQIHGLYGINRFDPSGPAGVSVQTPSEVDLNFNPRDYYFLEERPVEALAKTGLNLTWTEIDKQRAYVFVDLIEAPHLIPVTGTRTEGVIVRFDTADQPDLLLLAFRGDAVSNDHFPYVELLLGPPAIAGDDTSRPTLSVTKFYFDIAGIEGMTWWHVSLAAFMPLCVITGLVLIPLLVTLGTVKRSRAKARGFDVLPA